MQSPYTTQNRADFYLPGRVKAQSWMAHTQAPYRAPVSTIPLESSDLPPNVFPSNCPLNTSPHWMFNNPEVARASIKFVGTFVSYRNRLCYVYQSTNAELIYTFKPIVANPI
jgi:hypothetical protein